MLTQSSDRDYLQAFYHHLPQKLSKKALKFALVT
jgi:hypothetical protein